VTDHKSIEELKRKKDFGSYKIQRWFERIQNFDFDIEYREGSKMVCADALSRSCVEETENKRKAIKEKVMKIHVKFNHRKTIMKELLKENVNISENLLKKYLNECFDCKLKDKKIKKTCNYVEVNEPGERIGIDILQISPKEKILMFIDYFSRIIHAKCLTTKESNKTAKYIEELYKQFPFKSMITDNGKEFINKDVLKFVEKYKIKHIRSIPYYHQSNGRIERANRTIRNAIRKSKGSLKKNLKRIIENYNNLEHRALGMSPNEAIKKENWSRVKEYEKHYKKEFAKYSKKEVQFKINDRVLLRNEFKNCKMDNEFQDEGKIIKREYGDVYQVKMNDGSVVRRHAAQLKEGIARGRLEY
jgi:hypothetical protein